MPGNEPILLVEDDENDARLILRAFKNGGVKNPIQVARSGEEAKAYLSGEGKFSNRSEHPLPIVVLLDLTLPGVGGFEVLKWIRQQNGISSTPVIVVTASTAIRDINKAYAIGANSFFIKDIDLGDATEFSTLFRKYWLERALRPQSDL